MYPLIVDIDGMSQDVLCPSPETVASAIGRQRLAAALGVRPTAVSNAIVKGAFPPGWYVIVSDLAQEVGVPCPLSIFSFLGSHTEAAE